MSTPAGRAWCDLYPTERTTAGLAQPFRLAVQTFIAILESRGCGVRITATRRPARRAWLMHYAWRIAREGLAPSAVPPRAEIEIEWTVEGAREMVAVYGLVARPSLTSRHIEGRAIDMTVAGWPGTRAALDSLGRSFGVHPLAGDPVHWSDDGH